MANPNFLNTSEIAKALSISNDRIIRAAKKLELVPCGKIAKKPSSHKAGKVWKAKTFRKLKRHFNKLAIAYGYTPQY